MSKPGVGRTSHAENPSPTRHEVGSLPRASPLGRNLAFTIEQALKAPAAVQIRLGLTRERLWAAQFRLTDRHGAKRDSSERHSQPATLYHLGRQDAQARLELAYALTVHKAQGSDFGIVFFMLPQDARSPSRELLEHQAGRGLGR